MPEVADRLKIFVSFATADGLEHAMYVKDWLQRKIAAAVYLYYERPIGEHFETAIQRAIQECHLLVFLMTPASVNDANVICAQEVSRALKLGKPVFPLRMAPGVIAPFKLGQRNYLDLFTRRAPGWDRLEAELNIYRSPQNLKNALEEERDLWYDRRPTDPRQRELFLRQYLEPLDSEISEQQRRLDRVDAVPESGGAPEPPQTPSGATKAPSRTGTRFISEPPVVPPTEFQDRVPERRRLRELVEAGTHRIIVLMGAPGSGKTAVLSKLAEGLRAEHGNVDWFAYLPTFGQNEVSPTTVMDVLARVCDGGADDGTHQEMLHNGETSWQSAVERLLASAGEQLVVLAVDNVDRLLDADGAFTDPELDRLTSMLGSLPGHRVTLVLSTSVAITTLPRSTGSVTLDPGLDDDFGEAFLRAMDPDKLVGLATSHGSDLRRISELAGGHPRTLEKVASLLLCDPAARVASVLEELELDLGGASPATHLMARILDSVSPIDRWVLGALAILGQPVTSTTVDAILHPYLPNNRSEATLDRLCRRRVIGRDGERYYIPAAEDSTLILAGIPPGDPPTFDEERDDWTRTGLAMQAAEYYVSTANPEPRRVQDLSAEFSEVEQRIRGGDFGGAAACIEDMNHSCLGRWGKRHLTIPWLKRLLGDMAEARLRVSILSMLANAHMEIGKYLEATGNVDEALDYSGALPELDAVRLLIQAGTARYEHGQITVAQHYYSRALGLAPAVYDAELTVKARSGLMLCCTERGELEAAADHAIYARALMAEIGEGTSLAGQLDLNEAWLKAYQGDLPGAWEGCHRARRASRGRGRLYAWSYCAEARLHLDQGDDRKALSAADRAIDMAEPLNDIRLLREAKNRSVEALLQLGKLDRALREAQVAVGIVQRHGALAAYTLKGIVELRLERNAQPSFDRAYVLATDYLEAEQENFEVWDLVGLIRLVRGCEDRAANEGKMVEAFQKARGRTVAVGVVRRIHSLIDQIALTTGSTLPIVARAAASSVLAG